MALRKITPDLIAHYESTGAWQKRTLLQVIREHAERTPGKLAVIDGRQELSYAHLMRRSNAFARWLLDRGLASGDVVAVQAPSRAELVIAHLACMRADLIFMPLSDHFHRPEVVALLGVAQPRVFVQHVPVADIRAALPSIEFLLTLDELPDGGDGGDDIELCVDPNVTHHAMISSGTTNLPKVSLWTDNNLWFFLGTYARRVAMTADDVALQIAPANTGSTGYVFPVLTPLLFGATSIMTDSWNAERALDILEARRPTLATAIPTQMIKMIQHPSCAGRSIDSLRVFTNAGAALAPEWAEQVEHTFGCRIHSCYGASDGGVPAMTAIDDPVDKRIGSVGRVVEEGGCRLVDDNLTDVPAGGVGEVIWRNATKSLGYLNDPVRTDEAFADSWYRSGDLGMFDTDGYLHIVGRAKDVIIRGGQNINPAEVEDLLAQHSAVLDVALVGLPDAVYGQRSCACVVLREGRMLDFDDLVAYLRQHDLAAYKLPESLEVLDELPYSTGHKVRKHELVELVQRRRERVSS